MMGLNSEVVICGAGIAGISVAYHLIMDHGITDIVLVDELPPLSLTSDKSTECYRNWWPGPGTSMVALMNRSIDLLEKLAIETNNFMHLNRRGYLYLTGNPQKAAEIEKDALAISALGAGPLRVHRGRPEDPQYIPSEAEGFTQEVSGADLFLDRNQLLSSFPFLSESVVAGLHVRRAGWFSAQQLGRYLLDCARFRGLRLIQARINAVDKRSINTLVVHLSNGDSISAKHFVNAAGPYLKQVGEMLGISIPVYCELHQKVGFRDYLGILPRDAPLLIWSDPQKLDWSAEDRRLLAEDPDSQWLLEEFPAGVHTRPEGPPDSPVILLLWEYHTNSVEPTFPPPVDPLYPEIALRGLSRMIPGLKEYFHRLPKPELDGGYYTKTRENRPLIGPLPRKGAWVIGALSGYGLMASMAAGELLARHIAEDELPAYARDFLLERYQDPVYQEMLIQWGDSGQL
jgi:glycine/D-amino acid oxidase-like deaminating enzyme